MIACDRCEGGDYTKRSRWIVEAARKRPQRQFIIDGEAVLLAFHGVSDFDGLHSGKYHAEVLGAEMQLRSLLAAQ